MAMLHISNGGYGLTCERPRRVKRVHALRWSRSYRVGRHSREAGSFSGALTPIIRGSWRLAMRAHDISRIDGGGCSGTLATRLEVGAGGESGTCRIAHGPQAAIEVASAVKA